MEPITFKINKRILEKMNKYYDSQMVDFDNDVLLLKAQAIGCDIEVNKDYIISFSGQNALEEAKHWNKKLDAEIIDIDENGYCFSPHIGAAETGSGDYIGPLCVVACYCDEETIQYIYDLGIESVDDLSNQEIIKYAKELKGRIISSLLVLDNSHYNKMIEDGINQANIRARLFNQAIVNVLQKSKMNIPIKVINQFVSPKTYFNYLKNEVIVVKDLSFETNASQHYASVLISEIISRYAYLQYYASMSKSLKMNLARGTGTNVDAVAVAIAEKYGQKILTKVAKLNFANTKRVYAKLEK